MAECFFRTGAAKVQIEYPDGFFPHKSFRGRYFTGIHDDLFIKAVYISNSASEELLLVSVDAGDVSEKILPVISEKTGIDRDRIFVMATHTHAAPHFGGTWEEDVIDRKQSEAFAQMCLDRIIIAAEQARTASRKTALSIGHSICEININRDYKYTGNDGKITSPYISSPAYDGIKNREMLSLKFADEEGKTIAQLINYAVHSNVTFFQTWTYDEGMLVSGDLAGIAMRYVEEHSDEGSVALFSLAAAADQMPKYISNHRVFDKCGNSEWQYYGQHEGLILADAQGTEMGACAMASFDNIIREVEDDTIQTFRTTITAMSKEAGTGAVKKNVGQNAPDDYSYQYKETMRSDFEYLPIDNISMDLQLVRLGSLIIAVIPAEIVTRIGERIKNMIREKTEAIPMIISQCNGSYSYISDADGYRKMTFEAVASHFMPEIEEKIINGFKDMIQRSGIVLGVK